MSTFEAKIVQVVHKGDDMTTAQANPQSPPVNLDLNTVLLVVRMGKPGNRRKVKTGVDGDVNVLPKEENPDLPHDGTPDQTSVFVAKELLNSPELKAVSKLQGEIRQYLYGRALPNFHILKGSVHRLPVALVTEVDRELQEYTAVQENLVDQFIQALPVRVAEARLSLGALFNAADYPPAGELRQAFRIQYRYLTTDVPAVLGMISQGILSRERTNAVAEIAAETEEIKMAMRQSFADLIDHAASRLTIGPGGKKTIFKDTTVKNIEEFLNLFDSRNVVGDNELKALVERARQVLRGVTPDQLRDAEDLRASVRSAFTNIKAEMDRNLMLRPKRALDLK
jgi:hypothetical protein